MSPSDFVVISSQDVEAFAQVVVVLSLFLGFLSAFIGQAFAQFLDRMAWRAQQRAADKRRRVTM